MIKEKKYTPRGTHRQLVYLNQVNIPIDGMPSILLRCLNIDLLESRKPGMQERRAALEHFVMTTDPRIHSMKLLIDTSVERGSKYSCFAYLNYADEDDTVSGLRLFGPAILCAATQSTLVDASHMVVSSKADAPKRTSMPVFSVWIGNLFNADVTKIKEYFNRFGPLSTMAMHGLPPFRVMEHRSQRSAIFNYVNFFDAQAAMHARISFGPLPVIIRPRANMRLVQQVLGETDKQISFNRIQQIADQLGDERPVDSVAVLRLCRGLFVIDEVSGIVVVRAYM